MEKVLYLLRAGPEGAEALGARVLAEVAPALVALGIAEATANVVDAPVAPAARRRLALSAAPVDAVVSVWLRSATEIARAPVDGAVARSGAAEVAAHLVTESVPLASGPPCERGERRPGMAQVAFLRRPADLPRDEWLRRWLDEHTPVAIATQATHAYVQHVVVRHLTPGALAWDAIVEEGFPAAAMDDDHAFFAAVGDDDRLERNRRDLFASVQRFVDLGCIDVLPTSHHRLV